MRFDADAHAHRSDVFSYINICSIHILYAKMHENFIFFLLILFFCFIRNQRMNFLFSYVCVCVSDG